MNYEKIERTIATTTRFLTLAVVARDTLIQNKYEYASPSKEVSAMKRASMDLTRALAELRNPNVR
jgi:hypothetical protein